jgi:transcription antitermination factor NusG
MNTSRPIVEFPWYAVKIRTGAELRIKNALEAKGFQLFLPTYVEARRYSDRIRRVDAPLFPGYVFCSIDMNNRLPLITTPGVDCIVPPRATPQPVEPAELDAIRLVVASGCPAQPWPYLRTGDRVRIQYGSLTGLEGVLVSTQGQDRLVLSVHMLQRSISVQIERSWVRPLRSQFAS